MLEPGLILLRLAQEGAAMVLFGSSLFCVYALPLDGPAAAAALTWPKKLLIYSAAILVLASLLGLIVQTAIMAGSITQGTKLQSLQAVLTATNFAPASLVRAAAGAAALCVLILMAPQMGLWHATSLLGAIACASLAWMGHGAATAGTPGRWHLAADVIHVMAAGMWVGALTMFMGVLCWPDNVGNAVIHRALKGFGALGSALVAIVVATGLINSWFLIGLSHVADLWSSAYGRLLTFKLLLFASMLLLAATNRLWLTPGLERNLYRRLPRPGTSLTALRISILLEASAAVLIIFLVAWLGTLPPPSAQ